MIDYILHLNPGIIIALVIVIFIGIVSQAALYAKAGEPWVAALVPIWNVMIFVDLVGRPKSHSLIILIPGTVMLVTGILYWPEFNSLFIQNPETLEFFMGPEGFAPVMKPLAIIGIASIPMIIFVMVIFTEICDSFGKHKTSDKILAIIFNGAYILFVIGLSPVEYEGPWYKKKRGIPFVLPVDPKKVKAQQMAAARALSKAAGHDEGHGKHGTNKPRVNRTAPRR